jgi:hypothetical protein
MNKENEIFWSFLKIINQQIKLFIERSTIFIQVEVDFRIFLMTPNNAILFLNLRIQELKTCMFSVTIENLSKLKPFIFYFIIIFQYIFYVFLFLFSVYYILFWCQRKYDFNSKCLFLNISRYRTENFIKTSIHLYK